MERDQNCRDAQDKMCSCISGVTLEKHEQDRERVWNWISLRRPA